MQNDILEGIAYVDWLKSKRGPFCCFTSGWHVRRLQQLPPPCHSQIREKAISVSARDAKAIKSAVRTAINSYSPTNKLHEQTARWHVGVTLPQCIIHPLLSSSARFGVGIRQKQHAGNRTLFSRPWCLSQFFLLFMWRDKGDHCTECCLCEAATWGFWLHLPARPLSILSGYTGNTLSGWTIRVTIGALKKMRRDQTFSGIYGETVHAVRELLLWLWGPGTRCQRAPRSETTNKFFWCLCFQSDSIALHLTHRLTGMDHLRFFFRY